jgi:oligopeptide transport system substrate-binding protein
LLRTLDPAVGAPEGATHLLYDIKNARAYHKGEISDPDKVGVKAIDELTLEVELERAASFFLQLFASLDPIPAHVVEAHGDAWTDLEHIVTNGPFQMESYKRGKSIMLVRNPTYYGEFLGNLERIDVRFSETLSSPDEKVDLYERDRVDRISLGESTFLLRHRYAEDYNTGPMPYTESVYFDTSRPPFNDLRVRRAFVMAVDRDRLANEILDGIVDPATGGLVPPTIPGHSPGIGLPYDPDQARRLLAQAGYPDGHDFPEFDIVYFYKRTMLEYLKSQWLDNLNVDVALEFTDLNTVLSMFRSKNVYPMGWVADYPDPDSFLRVCVRSHIPHWRNDQYDQLLEAAQQTLDQLERMKLYKQMDKILIEQAVIMPITYGRHHELIKRWVKYPFGAKGFEYVIIEPH